MLRRSQFEDTSPNQNFENLKKSRVGAPANYNYQSATCPPDPESLNITELNSKKCSVAPNSFRVSYHFLPFFYTKYETKYFLRGLGSSNLRDQGILSWSFEVIGAISLDFFIFYASGRIFWSLIN